MALAQFSQQGPKLVGTGATGAAQLGISVSLSADGNTAIVGGSADNNLAGAAWVYTRSGTTWAQQGPKLVGTGATGAARQGTSVSLSDDGNTAIVGGPDGVGAVWVYTRSGTTWTQQGPKLVGTGATGAARQGFSVSLSADGNTAMVGAPDDDNGAGAVWVYTRSGTTWIQQGPKLVGRGATGAARQGFSVSLSADGNTAIVGGPFNDNGAGAVWVYTRSGTTWVQQGDKLVGAGATGAAELGISVSLSADGNTAIVGGGNDNGGAGAAWVYTRSGTTWVQQGHKLVGTGANGAARQGISVSLSADGNMAIVGGSADSKNAGAAWFYTRIGTTWTQEDIKLVGTGATEAARQGTSVSLCFHGNGSTAIVGAPFDNHGAGAVWVYTRPLVLNMIAWADAINTLVDTGPPGESPGDLYVFTVKYFFAGAPDTPTGITAVGRCVLIDPGPPKRYDCSITTKAPNGDYLMTAGMYTQVVGSLSVYAIVGGTGVYRRARGEVRAISGPFVGPDLLTVILFFD